MNAPIDITAHFSMDIASASKRMLPSPPSPSDDAGSRDSFPHGYGFRHRGSRTETWIFSKSFENLTASV